MLENRANSEFSFEHATWRRRKPTQGYWLGPAAWSLLAHVAGVALGVKVLSGDLAGDLTGTDPIPIRDPVTLRITAAPLAPEPMTAEPLIPEQPEPQLPEPVALMEETPTTPPEPPKAETPPDEPQLIIDEAFVAKDVPPPAPEPAEEMPKSDAIKNVRAPSKPMVNSMPPATKPVTAQALPGRTARQASGSMRLCTPADYLRRTAIRYPDEARSNGLQGQVMLAVALDAEGRPTSVDIRRSSGHGVLDEAACRAVASWRFRPERAGGIAVPSRVLVPVRFAIE